MNIFALVWIYCVVVLTSHGDGGASHNQMDSHLRINSSGEELWKEVWGVGNFVVLQFSNGQGTY